MNASQALSNNGVAPLAAYRLTLLIRKATMIREAVTRFERDWPRLTLRPPMPGFAWTELERQLLDLAPQDLRPVVRDLVSAVRKEASTKPPEMVLREVLIIASTVLDEDFRERCAADSTPP